MMALIVLAVLYVASVLLAWFMIRKYIIDCYANDKEVKINSDEIILMFMPGFNLFVAYNNYQATMTKEELTRKFFRI